MAEGHSGHSVLPHKARLALQLPWPMLYTPPNQACNSIKPETSKQPVMRNVNGTVLLRKYICYVIIVKTPTLPVCLLLLQYSMFIIGCVLCTLPVCVYWVTECNNCPRQCCGSLPGNALQTHSGCDRRRETKNFRRRFGHSPITSSDKRPSLCLTFLPVMPATSVWLRQEMRAEEVQNRL